MYEVTITVVIVLDSVVVEGTPVTEAEGVIAGLDPGTPTKDEDALGTTELCELTTGVEVEVVEPDEDLVEITGLLVDAVGTADEVISDLEVETAMELDGVGLPDVVGLLEAITELDDLTGVEELEAT